MRKIKCFLFVLKQSYICDFMLCMNVPLSKGLSSAAFFILKPLSILKKCIFCTLSGTGNQKSLQNHRKMRKAILNHRQC